MESEESDIYLLGAAFSNGFWELADHLMDVGARPAAETLASLGHYEKYGKGERKQPVIDRARSYAA